MIVTFNATTFKARYPEFASVADSTLELYFTEAGLYCSNTDASPVTDVNVRTMLLYMLTAHIAYLATIPGNVVGRVSSASEGGVSISTTMPAAGTRAWFEQTKYGASFWQATSPWRHALYVPPEYTIPTYVPRG